VQEEKREKKCRHSQAGNTRQSFLKLFRHVFSHLAYSWQKLWLGRLHRENNFLLLQPVQQEGKRREGIEKGKRLLAGKPSM
jgi:hypothetical protein